MKRPWAYVCATEGTSPRHCAVIAALFSSAVMCPSALVCRMGSSLCWKTPMNAMPSTKSCGTNCSAARFWWVCSKHSDATTNAEVGLAKKYSKVLTTLDGVLQAAEKGEILTADGEGDGLSPAGRRFLLA